MMQGTVVHRTKPIEFGDEADTIRVCITDKQGQVQMASPDFFEGLSVATAPASNYRLEIKCGDNGTILAFEDIVNVITCENKWAGWCRVAEATVPGPWFHAVLTPVAPQSSRKNAEAIIVARTAPARDALQTLQASIAVAEFDIDGTMISANEHYLSAFGYDLADMAGQHHSMLLFAADAASMDYGHFWATLRKGLKLEAPFRRRDKYGREKWIQAAYCPVSGPAGSPNKIIEFAIDITRQKLRDADHESQIEAIRKSMCMVEFTLDGFLISANDRFLDLFGYRIEELAGAHHSVFAPVEFRDSPEYQSFWKRLTEGFFQASQFRRVAKDGSDVWLEAIYNPVLSPSGRPCKIIKLARDISEQKRQLAAKEYAISHAASHDTLTQVLNRYGLRNRFAEERQKGNHLTSIMLVDLDGFKPVNDTYGHFVGDEVLREVAHRLQVITAGEGLVARLGGDEFAIGLTASGSSNLVPSLVADELLALLRRPITISGLDIVIGASIGIAVNVSGDDELDVLLRRADIALYTVKHNGKNGFHVFDAD
ncbi:diguanylate cyclase (GGDEF)-like protein/PAS domain S-box-containing protein [Rhizobium skierniewicense]|uniref:Diguanylate cyclase (GGDEF)-like protein/PAS domain S-box-containing protein n=1 Tax=Rhizobium skierniewicense TaxID=984260 RepID=A0A7W6G1L9_9HYPH|nr:diguanylate cyclase [Rhizobium skierniewicense]MBB3945922.1 diguanylate cyclase (GGDEF)-like protein/PAS domain S-box-containing protein [Rhizobium skierniewicense]